MEVKQCVILAGGQGTRLGNLTKKCPKPLVKIRRKPFLFYLINFLKLQGFKKFVILTHYLNKNFINYFNKNFLDTDIKIVKEKEKLGTGGSIRNA
jgi:NDP-sugar pyrophosphorylase family protein